MKKRKKHKESILQEKDGCCWLCERTGDYRIHKYLDKHHVFGGVANRTISEAEGFVVYLCKAHHTDSNEAVHRNAENMLIIRQAMQRRYEETHSREEFVKLIGRSYL